MTRAVVIAVVALACAACSTPTATPLHAYTAEELVQRATEAVASLDDWRATGTIETTAVDQTQSATTVRELTRAGAYRFLVESTDGSGEFNEVICVDGVGASRDGPEEPWRTQPGIGPGCPGDRAELAAYLPGNLNEVVGTEMLNGQIVYHLRGSFTTELRPTPEPESGYVVQQTSIFDVYVDADDFLALRVVEAQDAPFMQNDLVNGTPTITTTEQSSITTLDFEYNVGVTIELPEGVAP